VIDRKHIEKARGRPARATLAEQFNSAYAALLLPFYRMRYCYEGTAFPEELFQQFKAACVAFARAHARYEEVLGNQIARINGRGRVSESRRAGNLERADRVRKLRWDVEETYAHLERYRERGEAPPRAELSPLQWLGVPPHIDKDMKRRIDNAE
jgi:hypothetical protein